MTTPRITRAALHATVPTGERSQSKKPKRATRLPELETVCGEVVCGEAMRSLLVAGNACNMASKRARDSLLGCSSGRSASFIHITMSWAQVEQPSQCCSTWLDCPRQAAL